MTAILSKESLANTLQHLPIPQIHYYDEIDSTNEQALKLASDLAEEYTLLIAERQTAGRGRMGRRWVTTEGSSLAFTIIFKPNKQEIGKLSLFSLLGGLAVCRTIQSKYGADAQVKWPNDVLMDSKKTAGILAETCWQGEKLTGLVLGIGINLLPGSVPPADELLFPATCVQAHCGQQVERLEFLSAVLGQIIELRNMIMKPAFMQEYTSRLAFIGQQVQLSARSGKTANGILVGVDNEGQLILKNEAGKQKSYPIGDLHLRPGTNQSNNT